MKALVVGFGSIGKRHALNLVKLGCVEIIVVDPFLKTQRINFEGYDLECRRDIESVDLAGISFALICSPSHFHVEQAIYLAKHCVPLFIEKPLSFTLEGIDELCCLVDQNGVISMVACNLLFSQPIKVLTEALESGRLGQVYSVQAHVQHYLPNMRPGADKERVYAFHADQGGGVSLDCGSHEVQYLQHLFGDIENVIGGGQKRKIFGTSIEESATFQFRHDSGIVTSLTMDYLSRVRTRGVRVTGSDGSFFWDEYGKPPRAEVKLVYGNDESEENHISPPETDPYMDELGYFIECVSENRQTMNPISNSAKLQGLLLQMRGMEF